MVGKGNQNVFLIQIDASNFAEFDKSEFEITRVDCTLKSVVMFPLRPKLVLDEGDRQEIRGAYLLRCSPISIAASCKKHR